MAFKTYKGYLNFSLHNSEIKLQNRCLIISYFHSSQLRVRFQINDSLAFFFFYCVSIYLYGQNKEFGGKQEFSKRLWKVKKF